MPQIFGKSSDKILKSVIAGITLLVAAAVLALAYYTHPDVADTGYAPIQPVAYSHKLHAGDLAMDCYYCHFAAEQSAHAAIPSTAVCMNCHASVKADSPRLALVRQSYDAGQSIPWVRVHRLPDYVYFNHQAHVASGVSCVSCHGRVDQMEVVKQVEPLSMAWCLDCHRNPDARLRPPEFVTRLSWRPDEDAAALGRQLREAAGINPPVHCSGCHR